MADFLRMRLVELRRRGQPPLLDAMSGQALDSGPLRKLGLADRQARNVRYMRLSLTDRCNLRCTYCMPANGIENVSRLEMLSFDEIERLVAAFAEAGLQRLRLTGGEPTVRRDMVDLVGRLTRLSRADGSPLPVVMTSNGVRLAELAEPLVRAGLAGITVSIDSLRRERFERITRRDDLQAVVSGIEACARAGVPELKLNAVAIAGFNCDEYPEICRFAWDHGATPRFIELMPMSAGQLYVPGEAMPAAVLRRSIADGLGGELEAVEGGAAGPGMGPARYWRVVSGPYAGRRLGTIAAMTENFCASCNRIRVTARGELHACLANDEAVDLRSPLRAGDGAALAEAVARALGRKLDEHGFRNDGRGGPTKSMTSIGG